MAGVGVADPTRRRVDVHVRRRDELPAELTAERPVHPGNQLARTRRRRRLRRERDLGHRGDQRRRDAVPGHVGDQHPQPPPVHHEVVHVAADAPHGLVAHGDVESRHGRRAARQQRRLDAAGRLQLVLHGRELALNRKEPLRRHVAQGQDEDAESRVAQLQVPRHEHQAGQDVVQRPQHEHGETYRQHPPAASPRQPAPGEAGENHEHQRHDEDVPIDEGRGSGADRQVVRDARQRQDAPNLPQAAEQRPGAGFEDLLEEDQAGHGQPVVRRRHDVEERGGGEPDERRHGRRREQALDAVEKREQTEREQGEAADLPVERGERGRPEADGQHHEAEPDVAELHRVDCTVSGIIPPCRQSLQSDRQSRGG